MKCPNCGNIIEIGSYTEAVPTKERAKWYQFTNVKYRGFGINIIPRNPDAKWYQYTENMVQCDNCAIELTIRNSMDWLRTVAVVCTVLAWMAILLFPELKYHYWMWLLFLMPPMILLFIAFKASKYTIEISKREANNRV